MRRNHRGTANQTGATSVTVSHADTSSVLDLTGSTNTFITGQTYDTYGHVQTRTTGSVDFTVAANSTLESTPGWTLGSGETLKVYSTNGNISFTATGVIN